MYKKSYNTCEVVYVKVKNINSSSRRTDMAIKEAFAKLLQEKKELNNITVTELVKRASITRASFYTHYDSIYDVAQELQNETLEILFKDIDNIQSINDFDNYIDMIFDYLKKNEKIYFMMLSSNDPLFFANKLNKLINRHIYEVLKNKTRENLILKITFYTDGCMNLLIKYFRKEINYSLDDLNKFFKDLFRELFIK